MPYTWDANRLPYVLIESNTHLSRSTYKLRPSRVPLSAHIDSPTTGAPWPAVPHGNGSTALPRSVAASWWETPCPPEKQFHLNTTQVNAELGLDTSTAEGAVIVEKWAKYLTDLGHKCVNIMGDTPRVMDYECVSQLPMLFCLVVLFAAVRCVDTDSLLFLSKQLFLMRREHSKSLVGSDRLGSIWQGYSRSPIMTHFNWSSIVHDGVNRNMHLITPPLRLFKKRLESDLPFIPGLVSLHIRRGDYESRTSNFGCHA